MRGSGYEEQSLVLKLSCPCSKTDNDILILKEYWQKRLDEEAQYVSQHSSENPHLISYFNVFKIMKLQYDYDMAHLTYTPHELSNAYRTYMMYAYDGQQLKEVMKLKNGKTYPKDKIVDSNINLRGCVSGYTDKEVKGLKYTKKSAKGYKKLTAYGYHLYESGYFIQHKQTNRDSVKFDSLQRMGDAQTQRRRDYEKSHKS